MQVAFSATLFEHVCRGIASLRVARLGVAGLRVGVRLRAVPWSAVVSRGYKEQEAKSEGNERSESLEIAALSKAFCSESAAHRPRCTVAGVHHCDLATELGDEADA